MLNASWATLLRQIPEEQHNQLMLRTANGTEISVQNFLRIDYEFAIFKGRLAGSQDAGRLFILPYSNLDYLGINRFVKDEEYTEIFGGVQIPDPNAAAAAPVPAPAVTAAPPPAPLPAPPAARQTVADPGLQAIRPSRMGAPVKSSVLERFRMRNSPLPGNAGVAE